MNKTWTAVQYQENEEWRKEIENLQLGWINNNLLNIGFLLVYLVLTIFLKSIYYTDVADDIVQYVPHR